MRNHPSQNKKFQQLLALHVGRQYVDAAPLGSTHVDQSSKSSFKPKSPQNNNGKQQQNNARVAAATSQINDHANLDDPQQQHVIRTRLVPLVHQDSN